MLLPLPPLPPPPRGHGVYYHSMRDRLTKNGDAYVLIHLQKMRVRQPQALGILGVQFITPELAAKSTNFHLFQIAIPADFWSTLSHLVGKKFQTLPHTLTNLEWITAGWKEAFIHGKWTPRVGCTWNHLKARQLQMSHPPLMGGPWTTLEGPLEGCDRFATKHLGRFRRNH